MISNASEKYRRLNRRQPQGDELLRPSPTIPKNSHRNSHRHKKTHTKSTRQDTARYDKQSRETVVAQGLCANKTRQEKSRKNKRFIAGSQEVSGSIPLISTRKSPEILRFQDSFFAFAPFDQGYRLASPPKYLTPCPGNCGMIRPARYRVRKSRAAEREGEIRGRQEERLSFVAIFAVS